MHDDSHTTASKGTHSVSEAKHEEGQFGPWMVVCRKNMGIKVQGQVRLRRVQVHQPGILHPTTFLKTQMGLTCPLVVLRYARMSKVEGFYTN